MSTHVMVDLETFDTRPTASILSIGACVMDPESGIVTETFYRAIDQDSCDENLFTCSDSTKKWWSEQSEEARFVLIDPNRVTLIQALSDFSNFLRFQPGGPTKAKIWGNGSDFDNVILAHAYEALGFEAPWRFYHNRCFRTAKNILRHKMPELSRDGTYHNALDDAIHQARHLLLVREDISWT